MKPTRRSKVARIDLDPPANARSERISTPTLIVVGERDLSFYDRPIADRLEQCIPHARQVVIPEAGHMTNMEQPEILNRVVLSFLAAEALARSGTRER